MAARSAAENVLKCPKVPLAALLNASRLSAHDVEHPHPPLRVGLSLEGEAASAASGEGAYAAQLTGKHLANLQIEALSRPTATWAENRFVGRTSRLRGVQ